MTARASTRTLPATGGGVIRRTVLPGGLRIVTEAMPGVRSASVGIWVGVGSRDETPSVAGSSHFLEHLLFKGTSNRSALDIAMAMDAVGGEFNAFTEKEHTCFYATVLDRELPLAVDMISDVVLNATIAAGRRRRRAHRGAGRDRDARRRPVGPGARRVRARRCSATPRSAGRSWAPRSRSTG